MSSAILLLFIVTLLLHISFCIREIKFSNSFVFFRSSCKASKILLGWVLDSGALALAGASILACDFLTGLIELNSL